MRLIEKKWGNRGSTLYMENYGSYLEFYNTLMERQPNACKKIENVLSEHSKSWVGIESVAKAKELLLNGWDTPLERIKDEFKKELDSIEKEQRSKMFNNVCGFIPIVPSALKKLPHSMLDIKAEKRKSKVLHFVIVIDRSCDNDTETIIKSMSKQMAYITSLERSGKYRCRIEVAFAPMSGVDTSKKYSLTCKVLIKSENQLFDTKRVCYPVIHPSMLRLFMFAWCYSVPLKYDDWFVWGLGTSYEHWTRESKEAFEKAISENNEKVIVCDLFTNIQEKCEKGGL